MNEILKPGEIPYSEQYIALIKWHRIIRPWYDLSAKRMAYAGCVSLLDEDLVDRRNIREFQRANWMAQSHMGKTGKNPIKFWHYLMDKKYGYFSNHPTAGT